MGFSTLTPVADLWAPGLNGIDSFANTLVEGHLGWNLHNGFNVSLYAGAWLPSTQTLPMMFGRDYTAFQGVGAVSYLANGWDFTATARLWQRRRRRGWLPHRAIRIRTLST